MSLGIDHALVCVRDIAAVREWPFDEAHAAKSDLKVDRGAALLEFFLR